MNHRSGKIHAKACQEAVKQPCEHDDINPGQPTTTGRDDCQPNVLEAVLARSEFKLLEQLVGRFDLDASASSNLNAQIDSFCSFHKFLSKHVSGKHGFVYSAREQVKDVLQHECKARHNGSTSVCVVVLAVHDEEWKTLLHDFRLIISHSKGTRVLEERHVSSMSVKKGLPEGIQVLIDTVLPGLGSKMLRTQLAGQVAGTGARFLMDTGASQSFISTAFVEAFKLNTKMATIEEVTLPDGKKCPVHGCVTVNVKA